MGWTSYDVYEDNAYAACKACFEEYLGRNSLEVVDKAMARAKGRGLGYSYVGYAVVRHAEGSPLAARLGRDAFALVVLLGYGKESGCASVWYKDMDESVLPFECGMSPRMLAKLGPAQNESAKQWRENCRREAGRSSRERRMRDLVNRAAKDPTSELRVAWTVPSDGYKFPKGERVVFFVGACGKHAAFYHSTGIYSTRGFDFADLEVA